MLLYWTVAAKGLGLTLHCEHSTPFSAMLLVWAVAAKGLGLSQNRKHSIPLSAMPLNWAIAANKFAGHAERVYLCVVTPARRQQSTAGHAPQTERQDWLGRIAAWSCPPRRTPGHTAPCQDLGYWNPLVLSHQGSQQRPLGTTRHLDMPCPLAGAHVQPAKPVYAETVVSLPK